MTTPQPKSDAQLITDAVGAHGVFFKNALRELIERIPGTRVIGEEYPVLYLEGASLDLLVEFRVGGSALLLPIECKRALATMKKWIFFKDKEQETKFLYSFDGTGLNVSKSSLIPITPDICVEGLEIDSSKLRAGQKSPYNAASADRIWDSAFQVCKGGLGFLQNELKAREQQPPVGQDFSVFFVIVTTAPLQIAELPPGSVQLSSGEHSGELQLRDVPWLILHHPFTPSSALGSTHLRVNPSGYTDPAFRGLNGKEGILVVNAQHVAALFERLRALLTALAIAH